MRNLLGNNNFIFLFFIFGDIFFGLTYCLNAIIFSLDMTLPASKLTSGKSAKRKILLNYGTDDKTEDEVNSNEW